MFVEVRKGIRKRGFPRWDHFRARGLHESTPAGRVRIWRTSGAFPAQNVHKVRPPSLYHSGFAFDAGMLTLLPAIFAEQ